MEWYHYNHVMVILYDVVPTSYCGAVNRTISSTEINVQYTKYNTVVGSEKTCTSCFFPEPWLIR